jgi:hypothetical protein
MHKGRIEKLGPEAISWTYMWESSGTLGTVWPSPDIRNPLNFHVRRFLITGQRDNDSIRHKGSGTDLKTNQPLRRNKKSILKSLRTAIITCYDKLSGKRADTKYVLGPESCSSKLAFWYIDSGTRARGQYYSASWLRIALTKKPGQYKDSADS